MSQRAALRTCAFCEWVFNARPDGCPECGGPHYGARFVYGDRAYRYAKTQEPWLSRQVAKLKDHIRKRTK